MIILKDIQFYLQSVQVELPRANMVIDPRPTEVRHWPKFRCEYHDNGTTVTLILECEWGGRSTYSFRAYDPATETVPSFDSTIYTYMGEDGERAPRHTTVLIIHPSVTVIKRNAFYDCIDIKKCFVHDGVHTIESCAFFECNAMETIRLSQTLTYIGYRAFWSCVNLEAVFLPPSINEICPEAFRYCLSLRIFPLSLHSDTSHKWEGILDDCDDFFRTTQIQRYDDDDIEGSNPRVHEEIIDFYRNRVPPLHKICLDTHVSHQTIQQCIDAHGQAIASIIDHDGMTPLHILAMNPHADISALLACFDLNTSIAFVGDSRGNTPLDYLRAHRDGIEDHTTLISSLCMHRYAAGRS